MFRSPVKCDVQVMFVQCLCSSYGQVFDSVIVLLLIFIVWHLFRYSLFYLLFIFSPKSDDCSSGTLCGNHLSPARGSPGGFGGGREGTVRSGTVQGCWPMESTGSQLDCPLSGETLSAQSSVCPSCRGCRATHRSVSLSESAPSLSPAAPPRPTWLCLNSKDWAF